MSGLREVMVKPSGNGWNGGRYRLMNSEASLELLISRRLWSFEGILDEERLIASLERTLESFEELCGHVERNRGGTVDVVYSGRGVRMLLRRMKEDAPSLDVLKRDGVSLDVVSHLAPYFESVKLESAFDRKTLLVIQVTWIDNVNSNKQRTVISLSPHHICTDGALCCFFFQCWGAEYSGAPGTVAEWRRAEENRVQSREQLLKHVDQTKASPTQQMLAALQGSFFFVKRWSLSWYTGWASFLFKLAFGAPAVPIRIIFDEAELAALKEEASRYLEPGEWITTSQALAAHILRLYGLAHTMAGEASAVNSIMILLNPRVGDPTLSRFVPGCLLAAGLVVDPAGLLSGLGDVNYLSRVAKTLKNAVALFREPSLLGFLKECNTFASAIDPQNLGHPYLRAPWPIIMLNDRTKLKMAVEFDKENAPLSSASVVQRDFAGTTIVDDCATSNSVVVTLPLGPRAASILLDSSWMARVVHAFKSGAGWRGDLSKLPQAPQVSKPPRKTTWIIVIVALLIVVISMISTRAF